jgi:hypothetical protein
MVAADTVVDDLVAIALAEGHGTRLAHAVQAVRRRGDPLTIGDLAVDGRDLIAAGVAEGPAVGATLRRLLDAVVIDPSLNTRDRLLALATDPSPFPLHASPPEHP